MEPRPRHLISDAEKIAQWLSTHSPTICPPVGSRELESYHRDQMENMVYDTFSGSMWRKPPSDGTRSAPRRGKKPKPRQPHESDEAYQKRMKRNEYARAYLAKKRKK